MQIKNVYKRCLKR